MDIDFDVAPSDLYQASPGVGRDELHRQMAIQLGQHLRALTGIAVSLQEHRRTHESIYSPANTKYAKTLPTENDWRRAWPLRECLKFMTTIQPSQRRSWIFGEAEASSLADFLGLPGEEGGRGARPGREWAKHDWARALTMVQKLAQDFDYGELDHERMADYEYAVMAIFAVN